MNKIPYCLTCAFYLNLENNPGVMVMVKNADRYIDWCNNCDKRIGHSKELNRLIGVYHEVRHEENWKPSDLLPIEERFNIFMKNKYNGGALNCFIMSIKDKKYSERTIREYFGRLVKEEDTEMYNRKKLIDEILSKHGWTNPEPAISGQVK